MRFHALNSPETKRAYGLRPPDPIQVPRREAVRCLPGAAFVVERVTASPVPLRSILCQRHDACVVHLARAQKRHPGDLCSMPGRSLPTAPGRLCIGVFMVSAGAVSVAP